MFEVEMSHDSEIGDSVQSVGLWIHGQLPRGKAINYETESCDKHSSLYDSIVQLHMCSTDHV